MNRSWQQPAIKFQAVSVFPHDGGFWRALAAAAAAIKFPAVLVFPMMEILAAAAGAVKFQAAMIFPSGADLGRGLAGMAGVRRIVSDHAHRRSATR